MTMCPRSPTKRFLEFPANGWGVSLIEHERASGRPLPSGQSRCISREWPFPFRIKLLPRSSTPTFSVNSQCFPQAKSAPPLVICHLHALCVTVVQPASAQGTSAGGTFTSGSECRKTDHPITEGSEHILWQPLVVTLVL